MNKLTEEEFLFTLGEAVYHARLNTERMFPGWRIREAIDMVKLPLPPFNVLEHADEELRGDPIFLAVKAALGEQIPVFGAEPVLLSPYYFMACAKRAWKHYLSLPSVGAGRPKTTCMSIGG